MAIFGTLWDRQLGTRAGDGVSGVALTTMAHSLPATNPEIFIGVMRSVQGANVGPQIAVGLLAQRGNASLNTIGFAISSSASTPILEFEGISAVLHSLVR